MLQQLFCERESCPSGAPGLFYLASAEALLPSLVQQYGGAVQLIYLDPPFQTGERFQMKIDGKRTTLPAYTDTLSDAQYLSMMRTILEGCHTLLHSSGSLYVHVDYRMHAQLRLLLDELFGARNFKNEIIWAYKTGGRSKRYYPRKHDVILFYGKTNRTYFHIESVGIPRGSEPRNHMQRSLAPDGRVRFSIRSHGKLYHYYEDDLIYPSDVWNDIEHLHQRDPERTGYATQKPEALLQRILLASSRPGDLVADVFSGSGTTAMVASKTGRHFLAADCSAFALYSLRKRLLDTYHTQHFVETHACAQLQFPHTPLAGELDATWQHDKLETVCSLRRYLPAHGAQQLAYCAIGNLVNGVFSAVAYANVPTLPLTLQAPLLDAPVLQTVDLDGRQCFWQ